MNDRVKASRSHDDGDLAEMIEAIAPRAIMQSKLGAAMKICWLALWQMDDSSGARCRPRVIDTTLTGLAAAMGRAKSSEAESALNGLQMQKLVEWLKFGKGEASIKILDPAGWRLVESERPDPQRELDLQVEAADEPEATLSISEPKFDRAAALLGIADAVRKVIAKQDGFKAWHPVAYALLVDAGILSQSDLLYALGSGPSIVARGNARDGLPGKISRGALDKKLNGRPHECERAMLPQWPNGAFKLWDLSVIAQRLLAIGVDVSQYPEWGIRPN